MGRQLDIAGAARYAAPAVLTTGEIIYVRIYSAA
jgi:hypothetical protein